MSRRTATARELEHLHTRGFEERTQIDPSAPTCRHCHRPDCALLADVLTGREWVTALVGCERAQRQTPNGPETR